MKKVPKGKAGNDQRTTHRLGGEASCHVCVSAHHRDFCVDCGPRGAGSRGGGAKRITPYWRILKNGGQLNPKYPGGVEQNRQHVFRPKATKSPSTANDHLSWITKKRYSIDSTDPGLNRCNRCDATALFTLDQTT